MLDPWYGARRVFMPRRIISEGDDSSKTTKVTRKYFGDVMSTKEGTS